MAAEMTSKERLLGAMRSEDVDHVPNGFRFWRSPKHEMVCWSSERERLAAYRDWGWDAFVTVGGYIPHTAEEAVAAVLEQPEMTRRMIGHLDAAYTSRAELLLDLGVDGVIRSGWFESTDLWSPTIFRGFARPAIEDLTRKVHRAGGVVVYLMDTGIVGLLPDLKEMAFDCLHGADPILPTDGLELDSLRGSLPGKSIWGGLSGPEHFVQCTPEQMTGAVEKAFADLGRQGLILGIAVGIRDYYKRENIEACDLAWRRLRPCGNGGPASQP